MSAPRAMFMHALRGRSHTFLRCSSVTLRPIAVKRSAGRKNRPLTFARDLHVGASRRPLRRAATPTAAMMKTFATALHDTTKMSTATDMPTRTPGRAREVHERGAVSERAGARSHESRANVERF